MMMTYPNFTEGITMVQSLISQSPDIQKILAFEGAFEKLFHTITQEGGVDGGVVAQEALTCVDGLLRFNTSNQVWQLSLFLKYQYHTNEFSRVISVKRRSHQSYVLCCSSLQTYKFMTLPLKNLRYNSGTIRSSLTQLLSWA